MKARILVGLVAVALGGLTSCSNILEENGVINNVAKGDTGELRISLQQDPGVNVITKAGSFDGTKVTLTAEEIDNFDITVSEVSELTGKYSDIKDKTVAVQEGTYSISAEYGKMEESFAFNAPYFQGADNFQVTKGKLNTATINCSLQNSIIVIDPTTFNEFKSQVSITNVVAYAGSVDDNTDLSTGISLVESNGELKTEILYVKSDLTDAKIVVDGYVTNDSSRTFRAIANITNTNDNAVGRANKYNVKYTLSSDNGSLQIRIEVNGNVTSKDVTVPVNPYE